MNRSTISIRQLMLVIVVCITSATSVNAQSGNSGNVRQKQTNTMGNIRKSGYAPINGLQMYYEIYGEGTIPLVLVHGGGSTIETSFGRLLPLFSSHRKVIALELQAHGRTSDRDAPESFEQDADDVAALVKYLNVDKADFLGFSSGAIATLQIVIRHPDIVNKIISISGSDKRDGFVSGFFDVFQHVTLADLPEALKMAYLKVAPDKSHLQIMFEKDVARMANFKDISDDAIKSIKAPSLIMITDRDIVTPEHAASMMRLIPGARLIILPGVHGECLGAADVSPANSTPSLPAITVGLVEDFLNK